MRGVSGDIRGQETLVSGQNLKTINGVSLLGSGDISVIDAITIVPTFSDLQPPASVAGMYFWVSESQGTWWLPGSLGGTYYNSGLYYSNGTSWEFSEVPYQATQVEVGTEVGDGGVNNNAFVTPKTLNAKGYSSILRVAGESVPAHRAVSIIGSALYLFDPTNATHYSKCVGISYNSANIGEEVTVITDDEISLGIALTEGETYFAGLTGNLTNTPPTSGISQFLGVATSTSKFLVDIKTPIIKS